ncbi:MAG: hypothetical protein R3E60_01975 [Alphaproteobacteria bacterium]
MLLRVSNEKIARILRCEPCRGVVLIGVVYHYAVDLTLQPCTYRMTVFPLTIFDISSVPLDKKAVVECLAQRGFCILRGILSHTDLADIQSRAAHVLKKPAVAGSYGYNKYDHPKKTANPFILGGAAIPFMLHPTIIDIIETRMESECILAETVLKFDKGVGYAYFPLHTDFAVGWKKSRNMETGLTSEQLADPVGIGGVLYLHDTEEGAFTYCDGTHTMGAPYGQSLRKYPVNLQRDILSKRVRCDGKAGDLVLFDDRGFHGPDHPSKKDRLVILLDYYRVKTFGRIQVSPMPIWSTDLAGLSDHQIRVLGAGATSIESYNTHSKSRFQKHWIFPIIVMLIEKAYLFDHCKNWLKAKLRRS